MNTGAPVPQGKFMHNLFLFFLCISIYVEHFAATILFDLDATAVVQVEDTKLIKKSRDNTEEIEIEIMSVPTFGQDIRYKNIGFCTYSSEVLLNL